MEKNEFHCLKGISSEYFVFQIWMPKEIIFEDQQSEWFCMYVDCYRAHIKWIQRCWCPNFKRGKKAYWTLWDLIFPYFSLNKEGVFDLWSSSLFGSKVHSKYTSTTKTWFQYKTFCSSPMLPILFYMVKLNSPLRKCCMINLFGLIYFRFFSKVAHVDAGG